MFEGDFSKDSFNFMGCSYHHQISHVGNTTFPSFSSSLLEVSRFCPKGMETFFRKVIRNKDSVSPSPKLTVNVPENRPAFPQKERQTSFFGTIFSRGKLAVCFRHIFIYTHLEKNLRIPWMIPWSVVSIEPPWVSGVATVGFGDLAPVTSWEA